MTFDIDEYCDKLAKSGTEHGHQRALFAWILHPTTLAVIPELCVAYAVPNGGKRGIVTASKLRAEGVRAGVPDVCVPLARAFCNALYVEMKVGDNTVQEEQAQFHRALRTTGNAVAVCWSWRAARLCILTYLAHKTPEEEYRET